MHKFCFCLTVSTQFLLSNLLRFGVSEAVGFLYSFNSPLPLYIIIIALGVEVVNPFLLFFYFFKPLRNRLYAFQLF